MKMLRRTIIVVVICVAVIGVPAWWVTRHGTTTPFWPRGDVLKRAIRIVADGPILHYQENIFWSENQFSEIKENQDGFYSAQIGQFESTYGKQAVNPRVEFDEPKNLTILVCDVEGTEYSPGSYNFHWLLGGLPFDLYDFEPKAPPYGKKLIYNGRVNNVRTEITLEFPYELNHCHEHVWPA